ncbi:MAG: hypothetical protein LBD72_03190 [Puniceicoccales bacterium]|jgi:hypothetical protein|nr:hypothetical protein [Puniceicoccales bacterium]
MGVLVSDDTASAERGESLAELETITGLYAKKVTSFNMLSSVIAACIGIMGVLWLVAYIAPTLFNGIPILLSFCGVMNWVFPISSSVFFLCAALARVFTILNERMAEKVAALQKKTS